MFPLRSGDLSSRGAVSDGSKIGTNKFADMSNATYFSLRVAGGNGSIVDANEFADFIDTPDFSIRRTVSDGPVIRSNESADSVGGASDMFSGIDFHGKIFHFTVTSKPTPEADAHGIAPVNF